MNMIGSMASANTAPPVLTCSELRLRSPGQESFALGTRERGVSFSVSRGELFALLGPSGCGKTTTLRIVGGFMEPTSGTIAIDGTDVTRRQPYERPTNTVFQSYALFPHLRVDGNVAYGLRMDGVASGECQTRVREALALVGLAGMERRRISELSGGQQQRVALARALVKKPAVLLLDEPLGALDLKVRRQMQEELVRIKRSTGTTLIHVTHDQEEACAIADRIAVMKDGMIAQVDTPEALYRTPRSSYVASFIDAGTIVRGRNARHGSTIQVAHPDLQLNGSLPAAIAEASVIAALLPRNRVKVKRPQDGRHSCVRGIVDRFSFTGSVFNLLVRAGERLMIAAALTLDDVASYGEEGLRPGSEVELCWRWEDVVFVEDSEGSAFQ